MKLGQLGSILRRLWKPLLALAVFVISVSLFWGFINRGTVKINISPTPATLLIGRAVLNVQGIMEQSFDPGIYTIIIRKEGYSDYETTLRVKARETVNLTVRLVKVPVELAEFARIPTLSPDGQNIYFLGSDSKIYRINSQGGEAEPLSRPIFSNPTNLSWSPDKSRLLVTMLNNKPQLQQSQSPFYSPSDDNFSNVTWVYEISSQRLTRLFSDASNVSWGADGQNIFYVGGGYASSIYQTNLDGSGTTKIIDIDADRANLNPSPDGKFLAWYSPPEGYGASDIYIINLSNKSQEKLTTDGHNVGVSWSPDGKTILSDKISPQGGIELSVMSISDKTRFFIEGGGGAENTTWSLDSINTYSFDTSSKSVVKVNTKEKTVSKIFKINNQVPTNFLIDGEEKNLYFTVNDALYRAGIK